MILIQKKIIAGIIIALIVLSFFIYLIIAPLINVVEKKSEEYLSNQEIINRLDKREYLYRKMQKSYNDKDSDLLVTEKLLISNKETVGFIFTLEELARQTNNIFEIKTVSAFSDEKEKIPYLYLKINLFGNFSAMLDYLSNLENNPYPPYRLIEINGISIKRLEEKNLVNLSKTISPGDLETSLDIKVYIQ